MLARIFGSRTSRIEEASWNTGATPNVVKRRQLPIEALPERDQVLDTAYRYWHSKRRQGLLPSRNDIDILEITKIIKHTHLIDVSSDKTDEWCFRVVGAVVPQTWQWGCGRDKISDCPWPPYRDMLLQDYGAVKFTGVPMYHEIAIRVDWVAYHYSRIVLPFADDGRGVDNLMSCVFHRDTPDLVL